MAHRKLIPQHRTLAALAALLVTSACASTPREPVNPDWPSGRVAGLVHTANNGEIEQGRAALQRATDARVREFAQRMIDDHTAANTALLGVVPQTALEMHPRATELQQISQRTITNLATYEGVAYDRTYMNYQVALHRWLLNGLDNVLIPAARGTLRTTLETQRTSVAEHLRMAEQLAGALPR